jgi:hypothetical protein
MIRVLRGTLSQTLLNTHLRVSTFGLRLSNVNQSRSFAKRSDDDDSPSFPPADAPFDWKKVRDDVLNVKARQEREKRARFAMKRCRTQIALSRQSAVKQPLKNTLTLVEH